MNLAKGCLPQLLLVTPLLFATLLCGCADRVEPNILLITVDTLRVDGIRALAPGGAPASVETPNLDALVRQSVSFARASTTMGTTIPAHASLFTGLYPDRHGMRSNAAALQSQFETLAEKLAEAGYETSAWVAFKMLLTRGGLSQGFGAASDKPGDGRESAIRPGARVLALFEQWLRAEREKPFFAWVHFFEPHAPYQLTPHARRAFGEYSGPLARGASLRQFHGLGKRTPWTPAERHAIRALYDGEVHEVDRLVQRILGLLDELGLSDDTIVVLTADHGQLLGEGDRVGHAGSLEAPVLHIPLLIRGPAFPPRAVSTRVSLVDLYPTLLELGGVSVRGSEGRLDGRSLVPALRGAELEERPVFAEVQEVGGRIDSSAFAAFVDDDQAIWMDGSFRLSSADAEGRVPPERAKELAELVRSFRRGTSSGEQALESLTSEQERALRELGYLE